MFIKIEEGLQQKYMGLQSSQAKGFLEHREEFILDIVENTRHVFFASFIFEEGRNTKKNGLILTKIKK